MSSSQPAAAYPGSAQGPYVVAPPPVGYPTRDGSAGYSQNPPPPVETKSRGDDGFWKGCCAAICCCWVLDVCFC